MNGLESFGKGDAQMAKRVTVAPQPKWTPEMIEKGEAILAYIKEKIDTTREANRHVQAAIAAQALGSITKEQTFLNLDPKIQSYLKYRWKASDKEISASKIQEDDEARNQMEAEWEELYKTNEAFRHGMTHPEDGARGKSPVTY